MIPWKLKLLIVVVVVAVGAYLFLQPKATGFAVFPANLDFLTGCSTTDYVFNERTIYEGGFIKLHSNSCPSKELTLHLAMVQQISPSGEYQATFDIYDSEGELYATKSLQPGSYVNAAFYRDGKSLIKEPVFFTRAAIDSSNSKGFVELDIAESK